MARRRDAVVHLVLQLRRPPGHLLGVPAARARNAADVRAAGPARIGVRVGLRARGPVCGLDRGPREAAERDPRRALRVERHLHRDDLLVGLQAPPVLAGRGGAGRDVLLSGLDVARERLPRQPDALARDGAAPDERVYRDDRRRVLRRAHRAVLRVAALVHRVRRARHPARAGAAAPPGRAAARRGGSRRGGRARPCGRRTAALRRVPAAGRPHAHAALSDGRVHVRELRRGGPAVVDAEVPLRQVPHGPGDGRAHGDRVRAGRQHGRRATGRLAGGRLAPPLAARPARGADGGRARRRAVRGAVRDDAVDRRG